MTRREAIAASGGIVAALAVGKMPSLPMENLSPEGIAMHVTCVIRYQIDPFKRDRFEEYARNWGRIIPRCGGHLVGYFLPYEGTNDVGWGLIAFDSLASYERYKQRLASDPDARANFEMAKKERFVLREERNFVEVVDGAFELPATAVGAKVSGVRSGIVNRYERRLVLPNVVIPAKAGIHVPVV